MCGKQGGSIIIHSDMMLGDETYMLIILSHSSKITMGFNAQFSLGTLGGAPSHALILDNAHRNRHRDWLGLQDELGLGGILLDRKDGSLTLFS